MQKLANAFMDTLTLTEKSHDLQLSSWRPRTANGVVPGGVCVYRQEKKQCPTLKTEAPSHQPSCPIQIFT